MTGDVATLLVLSHTPFLSEEGAWRTFLLAVAVVKDWVLTFVSSGAHVFALWRLGAAGDGWVQHTEPTVTRQLIKTGLPAGFTVPSMTRVLAAVETTVELVAADQRAFVVHSNTTKLPTLVSTTGSFLIAAFLARENKLIFPFNFLTWHLLHLVATPTPDSRVERAGPTLSLMAQLLTEVDGVTGSTGQGFIARLPTGGNRVRAALAF